MVTSVQNNTVDPALLAAMNGSKDSGKSTVEAQQDRFLTMLVAQMKNQDPLNPMDNAQVTSQMAQLSTVTGIDKLNETMKTMSASFSNGQSLAAASMIGRNVLVPGDKAILTKDGAVMGFDLAQDATNVELKIRNEAGVIVRTISTDAMKAGLNSFTWDGKTDAGTAATQGVYKFEVSAKSGDSKVSSTNLSFAPVTSITFDTQGVKLNVASIGEVTMSDVKKVY